MLARRSASHIAGKIGLGAKQTAQADKFMRAEAPVFNVAAPMDIHALGPLRNRTDAVTPMIIVGITASRPSQNGYAEFPEVIHCLLAIAVDVGNWRFLADPQTAIDT